MKIAYIANSRFPSEKAQSDQVIQMCSAFAKLGHEVTLFVPDRHPRLAEDPFSYYGCERTFAFERVPCWDLLVYPWLGHLGLWVQTLTFVWTLRRRLRKIRPDVVYSRELYVFSLPIRDASLSVWESHSVHSGRIAKWITRRLDGIVPLTQASQDLFMKDGVADDRIHVEPDAVNPALFDDMPSREDARARFNILPDEYVCLYTGKFTTMGMPKGLDESIESVRQLRAEGRNVRLLAVGGTPQELKSYEGHAGEGVEFLGNQPQKELKWFYAAADVALMPFPWTKHYAYFMSPLKLFEYLMSGLPIVTTDLPSIREVLSERAAYIAKPGDVHSLTAELRKLLDNPGQARQKGVVAKELSHRYTWHARAERIVRFLTSLTSIPVVLHKP